MLDRQEVQDFFELVVNKFQALVEVINSFLLSSMQLTDTGARETETGNTAIMVESSGGCKEWLRERRRAAEAEAQPRDDNVVANTTITSEAINLRSVRPSVSARLLLVSAWAHVPLVCWRLSGLARFRDTQTLDNASL